MTHLALAGSTSSSIAALDPGELHVQTEWLAEGTSLISVAGDVDLSTAPVLARSLARTAEADASSVIVDLSACTFLDSAGLCALLDANDRLLESTRRLVLVATARRVLNVLELAGRGARLTVRPTLAAALASPAESWIAEAQRRVSIRSANERLERSCIGLGSTDHGRFFFICECGDRACVSLLHLSVAEYEAVREHAARFATAPNHENPEVERVVHQNGRFAVVETVTGLHSKPARESNPRWQRGEPW